jgi:hypothetical protein
MFLLFCSRSSVHKQIAWLNNPANIRGIVFCGSRLAAHIVNNSSREGRTGKGPTELLSEKIAAILPCCAALFCGTSNLFILLAHV